MSDDLAIASRAERAPVTDAMGLQVRYAKSAVVVGPMLPAVSAPALGYRLVDRSTMTSLRGSIISCRSTSTSGNRREAAISTGAIYLTVVATLR